MSEEAVFLTQPKTEPYYVKEGEEGPVLDCSFAAEFLNRTRYEPSWTAVIGDHPKHLTRNDINFARDAYELLQNGARYSLRLKSISFQRNNGKYYCTILDRETGSQESAHANVVVLVAPEKPEITKEPFGNVEENDFIAVECQSAFGNPPPTFTWRFSNNTLVPESWYQVKTPVFPDKTSSSLLQWRVSSSDNGASLICEIWNRALPEDQHYDVTSKALNVFYAPKVKAGPIKEYNVEEGEGVEVTCTADGNPEPTKFEWYSISGGDRNEAAIWRFTAEKRLSGDFRCKATNRVDSGYDKLTLNVLFGPVVTVQELYTPAEGDSVTLKCNVDSNPPADTVIWQTPSGSKHNESHLSLNSLTRHTLLNCFYLLSYFCRTHFLLQIAIFRAQSGNYTCIAINTLSVYGNPPKTFTRTGSAISVVDVRAKPGKATIRASENVVIAGSHVILTCEVTDVGSPKAQYRWSSTAQDGTFHDMEQTANFITIENASLNNSGDYRCTPFNNIGEGKEARYLLEVIQPPKIVTPLSGSRIMKDDNAVLFCEAEGFPAPEIRWLKNGYDITNSDDTHWSVVSEQRDESCPIGKYCSILVSSQLRFSKSLTWSDKGVYTCIAKNGVDGLAAESSTRISVFHNPVILNEKYPIDGLAAAESSNFARIVCRVSANPVPRIEWAKGSTDINSGRGRYLIQTTALTGQVDEFESVLEISSLNESDYGAYKCRAIGDTGAKAEIIIKLQPKSRPQSPKNVRVFLMASSWMLVGWQPGFDGGEEQKFQFEYRKTNPWKEIPDGAEPMTFYASSNNATTIVVYGDGKKFGMRYRRSTEPATFMVHNITNLTPLSNYWLRVRAESSLGESDWTPILTATTADVSESPRLPRPQSLIYNTNQRQVAYQEPEMSGLCLLLLVDKERSSEDVKPKWRSVGCFDKSPIANIDIASQFRARFCLRQNISVCSKAADIVVTATLLSSAWKYALPCAVIALSFVLLALTLLVCCFLRKRSLCGKKTLRNGSLFEKRHTLVESKIVYRRPDVSAPLPQADIKNAAVHGSHSDSGIFTLGSLPNTQAPGQQNSADPPENGISYDGVVNDWCSNDVNDFSNDPYLHEYGSQYIAAKDAFPGPPSLQSANFFYDGLTSCDSQPFGEQRNSIDGLPTTIYEDQEDSDGTSCSASGGRRVMREIIV